MQTPKARCLRLESLEARELLSVTPIECADLLASNPEVYLPAEQSELNLIELNELTNVAFSQAADLAAEEQNVLETPSLVVTTVEDAVDAYDGEISLREAIAYATDATLGGVVTFDAELKGQTFVLENGALESDVNLTVDASAFYDSETQTPGITVDAQGESGLIVALNGLTLRGIKFQNGYTEGHGPIDVGKASADFADCVFVDNTGVYGGVLKSDGGVSLQRCVFENNTATFDGGALRLDNASSVSITDCVFIGNTSGNNGGAVSALASNLTLTGNVFENNAAGIDGGALFLVGSTSVSITDCVFNENETTYRGGAIYKDSDTTMTIVDSTFEVNKAGNEGGAICAYGFLGVENSSFQGNVATNYAGALRVEGTVEIVNSEFIANVAENHNAGAICANATLTIVSSVFADNACVQQGGAIEAWGGSNVTLVDSTFQGNEGGWGGAVYSCNLLEATGCEFRENIASTSGGAALVYGGATFDDCEFVDNAGHWGGAVQGASDSAATLTDSIFTGNVATGGGGGANIDGTSTIKNVVFDGNSAPSGGALRYSAPYEQTLVGVVFTNNNATERGGAICNAWGSVSLVDSRFIGNTATEAGGALYAEDFTTVEGGVFSANAARSGGAIYLSSNGTVDNSLIYNNYSQSAGGGVFVGGGSPTISNSAIYDNESWMDGGGIAMLASSPTVVNCVIYGNFANYGGGVYSRQADGAMLRDCTVVDNEGAERGGGLFVYEGGTTFLYNAILVGNASPDGADALLDAGTTSAYNVLSSFEEWNDGSNNYVYDSLQPLFVAPEIGDYRLAVGSQALDKGDVVYAVDGAGNALSTDKAGNPRVAGDSVDLGAYEYVDYELTETPSTVVTTNLDVVDFTDGLISLREAIYYATTVESLGDTITFDESLKNATIKLVYGQLRPEKDGLTIDASALYDGENNVPGLTIDAGGKTRVFRIDGGTASEPISLVGLTITGGLDESGGGIYIAISSVLSATNCSVSGNATTFEGGGGIQVEPTGGLTMKDCVVADNYAPTYGGGVNVDGRSTLTLDGVLFADNVAFRNDGGAIHAESRATATVKNSTFIGNYAAYYGG
ncbi:MAG: hypothetical protein IJ991_19285, partial [Thermoguttaceae bacterium]|nr:hypothetical protein [Thermoguttaceae bacterium]